MSAFGVPSTPPQRFSMTNHLYDALSASLAGAPDAPLIAGSPAGMSSYREFFASVGRLADGLQARGLAPGDKIAAIAPKSVEFFHLYLAALASGAVFMPINPDSTRLELQHVLEDARPEFAAIGQDRFGELCGLCRGIGLSRILTFGGGESNSLGRLGSGAAVSRPVVERTSEDVAALLYTSGTTGKPKGVVLSHGALRSNSQALCEIWGFKASDILIHALPVFHTHGLFVATNVALMAGASMHVLETFSVQGVINAIPKATAFMGVPAMYTRLLGHPDLSPRLAAGFRLFISGSAPLLEATHRQWEFRTGHKILERYGMTEANMITTNPLDGDCIPGTVGTPLPGVKARICDAASGAEVEPGEIGMLEIKSPGLFLGYHGSEELTRRSYRDDGYFITGDLARQNGKGHFVIEGRADDLVNSGGFNVYPKEVEAAIDRVAGVVESAVIGVPHPVFGQGVVAVVECKCVGEELRSAIFAEVEKNLTSYKRPKLVLLRTELPRNALGKVQKSVLRKECREVFEENSSTGA